MNVDKFILGCKAWGNKTRNHLCSSVVNDAGRQSVFPQGSEPSMNFNISKLFKCLSVEYNHLSRSWLICVVRRHDCLQCPYEKKRISIDLISFHSISRVHCLMSLLACHSGLQITSPQLCRSLNEPSRVNDDMSFAQEPLAEFSQS